MTVTIGHTILQLVIEGPAVSYEIVLSTAHDGMEDFASFIDNAETFLSSNVNPDDLALLYRTHEDD